MHLFLYFVCTKNNQKKNYLDKEKSTKFEVWFVPVQKDVETYGSRWRHAVQCILHVLLCGVAVDCGRDSLC